MTTLLLNLRRVPDDEAEEVRALLDDNAILFYETQPSMWGISSGGIWLTDPADRERAKALLADYQQERARRQRAAYDEARQLGTAPTLSGRIREQPVHVIGVLVIVLVLLGITVLPFVTLG